MSLSQVQCSNINERKSNSLIKRNSSQLLQHVTKIGLKRSNTAKLSTSPRTVKDPRASFSTSLAHSNKTRQNQQEETMTDFTSDTITNQILTSYDLKSATADAKAKASPPFSSIKKVTSNSNAASAFACNKVDTRNSVRLLTSIPEDKQKQHFTMYRQPRQTYYPALLSSIAAEMKKRIIPSDRIKNGIIYNNVFDGQEAVDKLKEVLGVTDRSIALKVGRALEAQRFFHDVNYENRLIDDVVEIYQFNELLFQHVNNDHCASTTNSTDISTSVTSTILSIYTTDDEEDDDDNHSLRTDTTATSTTVAINQQQQLQNTSLPIGVYTDLTHCYSPSCNNIHPCYSYTCPKREKLRYRPQSVDTREKRVTAYTYELQKGQQLWSQTVPDYIVITTPESERKRQETIFELIYTEQDFFQDLEYVVKCWIDPLQKSDIIPKSRRNDFIDQVFSNIDEIQNISCRLAIALRSRQDSHPIVSQISDIMEAFVDEFEPFVYYGSRQHRAKYIYEHERYNNARFSAFAEQTEKKQESRKLELNGYLTKPTSRLGKYPILLDRIHSHTSPNHPDKERIPLVIKKIKQLLDQVNNAAGTAKTRFELEQIQRHLKFKNKKDAIDLRLLEPGRSIVKQGILRKGATMDSTERQVILFDHYLVIAKKTINNAVDYYEIQKRPIPVEFLGVIIPPNTPTDLYTIQPKISPVGLLSNLPLSPVTSNGNRISPSVQAFNQSNIRYGSPIRFFHEGRNIEDAYTLFTPDEANRKAWNESIKKQKQVKFENKPVFETVDSAKRYEFFADIKAHHMVLFDEGNHYLLATDTGVYLGPPNSGIPRKILDFDKVRQVHVLEDYQLLLVLADQVLWQFPLDIILNGRPDGNQSIQLFGRKVRSNVPFFHVGECLGKTIICVPKPSTINGTEIDIFEPMMPKTEFKKKTLLSRLSIRSGHQLSLMNTQVSPLKSVYNPYGVWAIDNTHSLLLLTTPMGMATVNMRTKKVEKLLDPQDSSLKFITKYEKIDDLNPTKKLIAAFPVPSGDYLICYDNYAFYIDKKGRRAKHQFKIIWEGRPTAFAYHHPHVIAFEQHFIEIRSAEDGHLEQVIQGENVFCLHNGQKSINSVILGTMTDKTDPMYQHIFELQPTQTQENEKINDIEDLKV